MRPPRVTTGRVSDEPVEGPRDLKSPTSRGYAIQTVRSLSRYVQALVCEEDLVRRELDLIDRYQHWTVLGYETKAEMLQAEVLSVLSHVSVADEVKKSAAERLLADSDREAAPRAGAVEAAGGSRVVNLRHDELDDAVYVGRAMPRRGLAESAFANPYKIGQDGDRAEVIQKYRSWLLDRQELLLRLHELRGRRLACWCSPEPCHADVLVELVDADHVLDDLAAAGVAVEAREGRLRLSPASAVDEALTARVAAHKPAILSLLATRPDAATLWRQAVEIVAESCRLPPDVLEAARTARVRWIPAQGSVDS